MWIGDDFHHNGAFRLSYGFEYATMMETSKDMKAFEFDAYDTYEWYLRLGSLANINARYLKGTIPTWNELHLKKSSKVRGRKFGNLSTRFCAVCGIAR